MGNEAPIGAGLRFLANPDKPVVAKWRSRFIGEQIAAIARLAQQMNRKGMGSDVRFQPSRWSRKFTRHGRAAGLSEQETSLEPAKACRSCGSGFCLLLAAF